MRPPAEYISKRFKDFDSLRKYFKDVDDECAIVDALLFIAQQLEMTDYNLECLDNEYRGYDP